MECEYKDYKGNKIKNGDVMIHPDSSTFRVFYDGNYIFGKWRAIYENGVNIGLVNQISENGRAVLFNEVK